MCHGRRTLRAHLLRRERSLGDQAFKVSGHLGQLGPAVATLGTIGGGLEGSLQLWQLMFEVADLALAVEPVRQPGVFAPVARQPAVLINDVFGIADDRREPVDLRLEPLDLLLQLLDLMARRVGSIAGNFVPSRKPDSSASP